MNRRTFLKSSAISTGGFMLSFSIVGNNEIKASKLSDLLIELNGFVKITSENVIQIMSPNPEGGQGVKTSMPMIVAEELDVDFKKVQVIQADLDTKHFTRQFIGGSQAIHQGWQTLRTAGATARQMLRQAAAQQWQVPLEEISTLKGVLIHEKSGKKATYGELANIASKIPVPTDIPLKSVKDFNIIGKSQQNVDIKKLITGQPLFGIDIQKPGMLYAMVVHPPAFGLKLTSFNAEPLKKMKGIIDAFIINIFNEGYEKTFFDTTSFNEVIAIIGTSTWHVMQAKKGWRLPGNLFLRTISVEICWVGK